MQPIFDEMRQQHFATLEDAQRWMNARVAVYNEAGQAELAGLSPMQVHRLLGTDWSDFSVTRLAKDLTLADVERSAWYQGCRALIRAVEARAGIVMGDDGEDGVLDELDQELVEATRGLGLDPLALLAGAPDGAGDVFSEIMALALAGGLLRRSKGRILASKRSLALTTDRAAGQLYLALFRAYVRDLDLGNLYSVPQPLLELVDTLPFILYRLQAESGRWRSVDWLAKHALLSDTRARLRELERLPVEQRTAPMAVLVLQPLVQLDLMEVRATPTARVPDYRRTSLFSRLLQFDWSTP